jgi:hypothetical protein
MSEIHVRMNGWWHPITITIDVNLNNISDAERLMECLKGIEGNNDAFYAMQKVIKSEENFECGTKEFFEARGKDY